MSGTLPISRTLVIALLLASPTAAAQTTPASALEAGGFLGYNRMIAPSVDHDHELSATNGGFIGSATILFRSRHVLSPFLDIGYARIYSSRERVEVPGYAPIESDNQLSTWTLIFGPALDIGPLRLRGGAGYYRLQVHSTVLGTTVRPAEYDFGWFASIQGHVFRAAGLSWAPELRALIISEASTATVAIGLSGHGDVLGW